MIPIFLWSTVLTHERQPVLVRGRANTPIGWGWVTATSPVVSSSGRCSSVIAIRSSLPRSRGATSLEGQEERRDLVDLLLRQSVVGHSLVVVRVHRLDPERVTQPALDVVDVRLRILPRADRRVLVALVEVEQAADELLPHHEVGQVRSVLREGRAVDRLAVVLVRLVRVLERRRVAGEDAVDLVAHRALADEQLLAGERERVGRLL